MNTQESNRFNPIGQLNDRLTKLESKNEKLVRSFRLQSIIILVLLIILTSTLLLGAASNDSEVSDVIRTNRLEIVDESGDIKAILSYLAEDPSKDYMEQPYSVGTGLLEIYNAEGNKIIFLGDSIYPSLWLTDTYGSRTVIDSWSYGIFDVDYDLNQDVTDGLTRVIFYKRDHLSNFKLLDEDGNVIWNAR